MMDGVDMDIGRSVMTTEAKILHDILQFRTMSTV